MTTADEKVMEALVYVAAEHGKRLVHRGVECIATAHLYENAEEVRAHGKKCVSSGAALLAVSAATRSAERAVRRKLLDALKRRVREMESQEDE